MAHSKKKTKFIEENPESSEDVSEEEEMDNGNSGSEKEYSDDGDSEEDVESQRTAIRQELSTLSFAELEALKAKIGTKEWNEAMFGSSSNGASASAAASKKKRLEAFKRDNKNRPREISSKIRVKKVREVVPVKRVQKRDPRFETLCGEYDEKLWSKNYEFIGELRKGEQEELKNSLKTEHDEEKRAEIKKTLQKLANKERSDAVKKAKEEKQRQEREENIQRMKEGKKPYYMKKSTKKFVELTEKYEELKSSGKLDSYLKKKRRKNALRDKKALPTT
jgi:ribosomal RNA-processing protein 36